MKRITALPNFICIFISLASVAGGDDLVDFRNDLIPVFTRLGCNAGSCHGAAAGRGGFKLSLYGGDADADYESVVHELGGRRINLADPEESLLVLKPTENLEHGGGRLMGWDDESSRLIRRWIRQGGASRSQRDLVGIEVDPRELVIQSTGHPTALTVTAEYADGTSRDVTRWTVLTAEDSSAVQIDRHPATVTMLRRGRHIVVARYLNQVVPIELLVPLSDTNRSQPKLASADPSQMETVIDAQVDDKIWQLGLTPSPPTGDAAFLRRIFLDLSGRLPTPEAVQQFLSDPQADKRRRAIEQLLASEAFTEFWTHRIAELFRVRLIQGDRDALLAYHGWLANQIRDDTGLDQIALQALVTTGDSSTNGPANFHRSTAGPREEAELVSEVFMGTRLRCANCHNHPLDRWTQDDYHGLAAIFATVTRQPVVRRKPSGVVIHPRTREPADMRLPGGAIVASEDGLEAFAQWLVDGDNPFFAKAMVNRLWKAMMGRGLVEPVDDFRATNPATHPELLRLLADDFTLNGCSIRHALRTIANSRAYQRSSKIIEGNRNDTAFYARAIVKPMPPVVLADAISDVLGVGAKYGDQPIGTRAIALVNPQANSRSLDVLGRCGRADSCEGEAPSGGLPQQLHLLNGELINPRLSCQGSRLDDQLEANVSVHQIMHEFAIAALGRPFQSDDSERFHSSSTQMMSQDEKRRFLEDFVWALVTCDEFRSIR